MRLLRDFVEQADAIINGLAKEVEVSWPFSVDPVIKPAFARVVLTTLYCDYPSNPQRELLTIPIPIEPILPEDFEQEVIREFGLALERLKFIVSLEPITLCSVHVLAYDDLNDRVYCCRCDRVWTHTEPICRERIISSAPQNS